MPQLLVFALFFAGVYFLLLRPQQQRVRRQRELVGAIGVGDRVVTAGGLVGRVVNETDERLQLEIADGVVVEFLRLAVSRRLEESEPVFADPGEELEGGYEDEEHTALGELVDEPEPEGATIESSGGTGSPNDAGAAASGPGGIAPTPLATPAPASGTESDTPIQEAAAPAPRQDPH